MKFIQKRFDCACGKAIYKLLEVPVELEIAELDCICGQKAKRIDLSFKGSSHVIMDAVHAEQGVRIFEGGKRKTLGTQRAVDEYAKRNNCTFGSNDTEEEAEHCKAVADKEYVERTTEKVMDDFNRLQYLKKTKNDKR